MIALYVTLITAGKETTMHELADFGKQVIVSWLIEQECFAERLRYRAECESCRRLASSILRCASEMKDELADYEQPEARCRELLMESISEWRKMHPGHYEPSQDVRRDLYADAEKRAFREAFPELAKLADEIAEMRTQAETGFKS